MQRDGAVVNTRYTANISHERACYFSRNGYAFALLDSRVRANSGGEFDAALHPQDCPRQPLHMGGFTRTATRKKEVLK